VRQFDQIVLRRAPALFPWSLSYCCWGGVSFGQYCKVALALLNVFFFAHVAGLLASTMSRVLSRAHAATAALLIGFLAGPLLLNLIFSGGRFTPLGLPLAILSPGIRVCPSSPFYHPGPPYCPKLGPLLLGFPSFVSLDDLVSAGAGCVAAAALLAGKSRAGPAALADRFRQWTYGPRAFREGLRRRMVGINPFLWLVSRNRLAPLFIPISLLLVNGLWIWVWFDADRQDRIGVLYGIVVVNHLLLLLGVASEASSHLQAERRSGALDFVLCSTPLQVGDILGAHWELLRRRFFWPFIAVLVTDVVAVVLSQSIFVKVDSEDRTYFAWALAGAMVMLVADVVAAGWVGMWRAMVQRLSRKTSGAGSATIERSGFWCLCQRWAFG